MITETGKSILGKYLIGQTPAYASYIALGCGAKPISGALGDYSEKKSLDFEMFRVPIISRGFVVEDGVSKVVLTAELPTEERYEFSEIGVYSAGSNPYSGSFDSRLVNSFSNTESWEYHTDTSATSIPTIAGPLDGADNNNIINQESPVFQTNADNRIFSNTERINRYERCRFLNNTVMMLGSTSTISLQGGALQVAPGGSHIHLTGFGLDLSKNSPIDEMRLAFSVINKSGISNESPDAVRVILEFASSDDPAATGYQYAKLEVDIYNTGSQNIPLGAATQDFSTNRYVVASKQLQNLAKSSGFTWSSVRVARIFVSVIKNGVASNNFYVGLDAVRVERVLNLNPLYGMIGYSVVKNQFSQTIVKAPNTTNYIEFRFSMDVQ